MNHTPIDITKPEEVMLLPWEELIGDCVEAFNEDENTTLTIKAKDRTIRATIPARALIYHL